MQMPAHYGDPLAEYWQVCKEAGVFDVSHRGKIRLVGKDAAVFLQNLCSNEVIGLKVGFGCEAFFLTVKARIVADAFVFREAEEIFRLDVAPGMGEKLFQHLDHHLISEQVEISDETKNLAQLYVAGPKAPSISEAFARCRHDMLGVPGYDLLCRPEEAAGLCQKLTQAGAPAAGLDAYEILRIEAGTPTCGIDFDESTLAMEAGRTTQAISFSKGCYLGQEPVVRTRDLGHANRALMGVKIPGNIAPARASKLFKGEQEVGETTSAAFSPRLQCALALAYVRRGSQEPGTPLEIETAAGRSGVEVSGLPFLPFSG